MLTMASKGLLDRFKNWKTALITKDSGLFPPVKRMAGVFKFGQMARGMTASGRMEWPMGSVDSCMLKVMFMRVSGLKIRQMATEYTLILTVPGMKDTGFKISSMVGVLNSGLMALNTMEIMNVE